MSDDTDFLDALLQPAAEPEDDDDKPFRGFVVWERAENSAEIERREKEFLQGFNRADLLDRASNWPIPFYSESDELEPFSATEVALLRDLGVEPREYKILYMRKGTDQ